MISEQKEDSEKCMNESSRNKKGYTLVEVIVTLTILVIIAGAIFHAMTPITVRAEQNSCNQAARTLFMAAQSALTQVYANDPVEAANLLRHSEKVDLSLITPESLSEEWMEELAINRNNIASLVNVAGGETLLRSLLECYVEDKTMLGNSILVEYNTMNGNVLACFYSVATELSHGEDGYNVYHRSADDLLNARVGCFSVEYTGSFPMRQIIMD